MKAGFFQDAAGDNSMGRLLAFLSCVIGGIVALVAVVIFYLKPSGEALAVVVAGIGLCGGSEWAKNKAKELENGSG